MGRPKRAVVNLAALPVFLGVCLAAVRAAAQPGPDPGEATFIVFVRGVQVGSERIELSRSPDGWRFTGDGRLSPPIDLATRRFEVRYSSDWQPIDLLVHAVTKGRPVTLAASFGLTTAVTEIQQGGQTAARTDEISARAVVIPSNFFAAYEALAVRLGTAPAGAPLRVYLVAQAEAAVRVRDVTAQDIETPTGRVAVRRFAVTLERPDGSLDLDVWVDARHRLVRLDVPSASLTVSRQDVATVMARAVGVRHPGDRDVTIPAEGFTLAATMTVPATNAPRLPAVVLVGASGPQDRDEVTSRVPVFAHLAGALADAGYLVVRYDKRGVGQSGGRIEAATVADYALDVQAVVRFLRRRKDVDRRRIAVVAYGDGSFVALDTAAHDEDIRAVVLVAGVGTTGAEYTLERQARLLDRLDLPEADRRTRVELQQRLIEAVLKGTGWEDIPPAMKAQADSPWFRSFLAFDPAKVLPRVEQPLLIVQAERDEEVPAAHAERLAALGRARKKARVTDAVTVAGATHVFQRVAGEQGSAPRPSADPELLPELARVIADWLGRVLPAR